MDERHMFPSIVLNTDKLRIWSEISVNKPNNTLVYTVVQYRLFPPKEQLLNLQVWFCLKKSFHVKFKVFSRSGVFIFEFPAFSQFPGSVGTLKLLMLYIYVLETLKIWNEIITICKVTCTDL